MSQWYYSVKGERVGPVEVAEIDRLIKRNVIQPETPVWNGEGDWKAASATELGSLFAAAEAPPVAPGANPLASGSDTMGVLLIVVPLASLVFFYLAYSKIAGEMNLIQAAGALESADNFFYLGVAMLLISTAVLVGVDASKLGFGKKDHPKSSLRTGPGGWAASTLLLWIIGYPAYLSARKTAWADAKTSGVTGVLIMILVGGGLGYSALGIETVRGQAQEKAAEVRRALAGLAGGGDSEGRPAWMDEPAHRPADDLQLQEGWKFVRGQFGNLAIKGEIQNNGAHRFSYVAVTFDLFDKSGAQVGTALANNAGLAPNGRWKFEAMAMADNVDTARIATIQGH